MTELRSYNVVRIYEETVRCRIGQELCVDKQRLERNAPAIRELLFQIKTYDGEDHLSRILDSVCQNKS